ncbi:MT-A70-domain-containing protein [Phlyctochytrium arcticum]|nr:MT-A70-domain-containing protein [Phlyctochytrium arcticum]
MSRVSRTESGTRSSSVFSDSSAPSTPMTETKALDWTAGPHSSLEELLQKEEQLQIQIDSLTEEIKALRGQNNQEEVKDADQEDEDVDYSNFDAPQWCVPIKANVMTFEWDKLGDACQFDVILMDPPWQLASHAPTRGVAIAYQQLPDACIEELPIPKLQTNGFIFIWVINNKYVKAFELMERWGYEYVDDITWVKQTVNRRMAKGHGYYLQHAKETCLVGKKGNDPEGCRHGVASDVIFSERRGQSQKPEELYEIIEELIPNGKYLEIFGRKNNLRDFWVTVGNEL